MSGLVGLFFRVANISRRSHRQQPLGFSRWQFNALDEFSQRYTRDVDGKTYTIVDEWCSGFLQGIRLTQEAWLPLLEEQPDFLRPFQLFATEENWAELASAPDEAVWR